ncbi:5-oxoprolinase subunit PxpA [Tatumella citrea]|uniref:5-oxoprolinase subunit A n=1 Tax=Tatumella citrea TaxID=53336 RepID=A0A1Y0LDW5_TATCI|nr:5-oxoprolinase subunit PxpA [Tatumella citrea]ARU96067.1 lactam utilization protein LamB [Tatumella citrea]ARU97446.1 lactam utilization protein LamB [Tatumella citrea]
MKIDLNADLGEGGKFDQQLLQLVSSANIACGFHAGDAQTMLQSVRWAKEYQVNIGAHPSFPDRENFGRTAMTLPPAEVYAQQLFQIGALQAMAVSEGVRLSHVKPHGMLYNQAAREPELADAIARAVAAVDSSLVLVGLANSELINAGRHYGLTTREEVFADRGYTANGQLVPRGQPGDLLTSAEQAIAQTLMMVSRGEVIAVSGERVKVNAETVCLHGDGEHAVEFARELNAAFRRENISISA